MTHKVFLLAGGFAALILSTGVPAADADWQLFARGKTGKIYFDRASVRTEEDYVRFRYRVEFDEPRQTPNKKYEYSSAINAQAVRCDEEKYVITSIALFDQAGDPLASTSRKRDKWEEGLKEGKPGGVQERLIRHACKLAANESGDTPEKKPQARRPRATVGAGIVATREGMIVTNNHVARNCSSITVVDFRKNRGTAELVAADTKNDLALIRADR